MNQNQLKNIGSFIQYDIENNEEKGVGLGLFLSKKIIECYDGKLKINSTEGKGTKIELTIPLA
jgi:K+-sensing histidine kinase KdpD